MLPRLCTMLAEEAKCLTTSVLTQENKHQKISLMISETEV